MILFCEDCGEKNDLDSAALIGGKAVFKCTSCNYSNAYAIIAPPLLDARASLFKEIKSTSALIGGFLYHNQLGVVGQNMPSILATRDIETLGGGLAQSYEKGRLFCPDLDKLAVVISDKHFSVFKVSSHLYVIVIATGPGLPDTIVKHISALEKLER